MTGRVSITGEIALLWQDVDPYEGDVILITLDTDEVLALNTFELRGEVAQRYKDGVLEEGMRIRVECRTDVAEIINFDTGETNDEDVAVVVDVEILPADPA